MIYIKSYRDIINRQFSVNKKRNLLTILGIILSIILFTTVGFVQAYYKDTNILNAKNSSGNYEAVFKNISKEKLPLLRENIFTDNIGLYREISSTTIISNNTEKRTRLYAIDNTSLNQIFSPVMSLESGRFPEKYGEIIVDDVGKSFLNKEIDDIITLNGEDYKIVGFYNEKRPMYPYEIDLITYFDEKDIVENVNVIFTVKDDKNKIDILKNIASNLGINYEKEELQNNIVINKLLFYSYGERNIRDGYSGYNSKVVTVMLYGVILILTTFLVYGSINVSIKERIEQFSILRCIGATKVKIRRLLIKESLFLALFSLIPGIILGQILCYVISEFILSKIVEVNTYALPYKLYFHVIAVSIILTFINIALSTIIPIIKIEDISPIEGVKTGAIIQKNIKRRKSKLIKKIFGYNGELAYKNIRANNKNFMITTITSIIILSTFIVITGYKKNLVESYSIQADNSKDVSMDIRYKINENQEDIFKNIDEYKSEIEELEVSNKIYSKINYVIGGIFKNLSLNKNIEKEEYENYIREKNINLHGSKGVYSNNINLSIMDDESLNEVILNQNLDVTLEEFKDNGVLIVDRKVRKNFMDFTREPIFDLKKGDAFTLAVRKDKYKINEGTIEEDIEYIKNNNKELRFKYLGVINGEKIFDSRRYGIDNYINLIVSKDFYYKNKDILNIKREENQMLIDLYTISLDIELKGYMDRNEEIEVLKNYSNKIESIFIDNKFTNVSVKNNIIILSRLLYIVLALIIIIGGVNIVNNKNINIKLRAKEIGTLLALGINKKRLRKILILEGVVQWFIASLSSIILSYTVLKVIYKILSYSDNMITSKISILAIVFGCSILFIINILGVYISIRKLKYIDTIELIRNKE